MEFPKDTSVLSPNETFKTILHMAFIPSIIYNLLLSRFSLIVICVNHFDNMRIQPMFHIFHHEQLTVP